MTPKVDIRAKVRIGVKENGRPKAIDNFRCDDVEFTDSLGAPRQLAIKLPFSDPDLVLPTGLELWGKNGVLKCWCNDGKTARRLGQDNEVSEVPCTHPQCVQFKQNNCCGMGRFRFNIPDLGPGIFQIDTKSKHSIEGLMGTLLTYAPLDPDQWWILSLTKRSHGTNKWNVLTLTPIFEQKEDADG